MMKAKEIEREKRDTNWWASTLRIGVMPFISIRRLGKREYMWSIAGSIYICGYAKTLKLAKKKIQKVLNQFINQIAEP